MKKAERAKLTRASVRRRARNIEVRGGDHGPVIVLKDSGRLWCPHSDHTVALESGVYPDMAAFDAAHTA